MESNSLEMAVGDPEGGIILATVIGLSHGLGVQGKFFEYEDGDEDREKAALQIEQYLQEVQRDTGNAIYRLRVKARNVSEDTGVDIVSVRLYPYMSPEDYLLDQQVLTPRDSIEPASFLLVRDTDHKLPTSILGFIASQTSHKFTQVVGEGPMFVSEDPLSFLRGAEENLPAMNSSLFPTIVPQNGVLGIVAKVRDEMDIRSMRHSLLVRREPDMSWRPQTRFFERRYLKAA